MKKSLPAVRRLAERYAWPILAAVLLLAVVTPFAALAPYSHPFSDDYWSLVHVATDGPLDLAFDQYMGWTGRYASNVVLSSIYWIFLLTGDAFLAAYRLVPLLVIAGLVAGSLYAVRSWTARLLGKGEGLFLGALFASLLLAGLPSPVEGIYWLPGAVNYMACAAILLFLLGAARPLFDGKSAGRVSRPRLGLLAALTVFAVGMNENALVFVGAFLALACCVSWIRGGPFRSCIALLALAAVSAAAVVLAPGNAERLAFENPGYDILPALHKSWVMSAKMMMAVPSSALAACLAMTIPLLAKAARKSGLKAGAFLLVAILFHIFTLSAVTFPVLWGYKLVTYRVANFVYFVHLTGLGIIWFLAVAYAAGAVRLRAPKIARLATPLLFPLCLLALVLSPNVRTAYDDLASGRADNFRRAWERRSELAAEAALSGKSRVEFEPLQDVPTTVFFGDLAPDPYWWPNEYYAEFMGIGAVRTTDGKPWPDEPTGHEPAPSMGR